MNSLQALADSPLTERLGWILLHSIWQAAAVAIGLAVVLPAVRKRGAQAGYAVCCGALILTIVLPALTFPFVPNASRTRTVSTSVAISNVAISNGVMSADSAGMPIASRPMRAVERPWFNRRVPPIVDRPSAAPIATGSPLAGPTVETPAVELSVKERAATLGRQIQAQLSWSLPWIVLVWSCGVSALSLWNVGGWFAVQRLKSRATCPVTGTIQDAAARIARQLGLVRTVRLLQSALVETPVVIGALKPVILLPASLVTELPLDQLESLLAHELAHVLRQDYLVNLLQSAIETLLFYHPAVWWISSQVRAERENCCDDLAVGLAADRTIYVQALAAAAGARAPKIAPAATGGLLLPRLRRILGTTDPHSAHPSRWLTGAVMLSLCGTAIAFLVIGLRPVAAQVSASPDRKALKSKTEQPKIKESTRPKRVASAAKRRQTSEHPQFPTKGQMRIRVVGSTGQSIPEAAIQVSIWTDEKDFKYNRNYKCDTQGVATIVLPKTLWILRLWVKKPGYCEEFKKFQTNAEIHEVSLPDEFAFHLTKGTTLRGTVKNENGQPIQGARIDGEGLPDSTLTDAEGRWTLEDARPGADCVVWATHPDYLGTQLGGDPRSHQKVTTRATPIDVPTIVLRRGTRASVKVTDPTGKPVKRAAVIWGDDPYFQPRDTAVLTDESGLCRLPSFGKGPMRVTVVAKGWMPDSRTVEIAPGMRPIDFHLRPGRKLRIRFVDHAGAPVPGVFASLEEWRGVRHLHSNVNGVVKIEIPDSSDQKGVFEWDGAPDDAISFRFSKAGFAAMAQSITADNKEHLLTFNQVLRVTGTVRDAATGGDIQRFLVVPIVNFRPDFQSLERTQARKQKNGALAMEFNRTDIEHGVQIEASGYKTYRTTDRYRVGDADPVLDIRLQPAERYTGEVLGPDGRPVKGARVSIASRTEQLDQEGLKQEDRFLTRSNRARTDEKGAFEIASQLDRYALVVVAADGFAEVERQPNQTPGQIRLQRWASLTGQLVQSGKPVPNCQIFLDPIRIMGGDNPHNFSGLTATTRDDGSFAFERVPPVACRVKAFLHFSAKSPLTSSSSVPLRLQPGEKGHVILGGPGIDVTGQLVVENQPPGFDYHFAINFLVAKRPGLADMAADDRAKIDYITRSISGDATRQAMTPEEYFKTHTANDHKQQLDKAKQASVDDLPTLLARKGFDWRKGWSDSWRNSPEGQAYLNTRHHWFVKPEPDGRFRVSGVEPGEYDFAVNLYGTTEGCLVHPIATRVVHFSVKPGAQQLDLGKVSIPSLTLPKVGDLAADFPFTALDGSRTSLAASRGKYVLLDFWATWCGSCVAKLDEVEQLRKRFEGEDDHLVVIGVNLDADGEAARKFLKTKPLPWQHALLGDWSSTDVPRRFAISTVPAYVLIDPAGRILAHEYSLEQIASKLNRLAKEQPERDKHRS